MSFAAGSNPIAGFGTARNIDLMTKQDEWPPRRPDMSETDKRKRWHHSDAKDVAFKYNDRLFEDWMDKGQLMKESDEDN